MFIIYSRQRVVAQEELIKDQVKFADLKELIVLCLSILIRSYYLI
jgi:hypothetical protein